jgi:hypothetical protein
MAIRMTASKANRCRMGLGSLLAWSLALSFPVAAQTPPGVGADILATMDRLAIKLAHGERDRRRQAGASRNDPAALASGQ